MSISFDAPTTLGTDFISSSALECEDGYEMASLETGLNISSDVLNTFAVDLHFETIEEEDEFGALKVAFRAWFCIQGRKYTFTGRFFQRVPPFNGCARFYYKDLNQLRGCRIFYGRLGPSSIYLRLDNGVVIAGNLHRRLYRSYRLSGRGTWSRSK